MVAAMLVGMVVIGAAVRGRLAVTGLRVPAAPGEQAGDDRRHVHSVGEPRQRCAAIDVKRR
jgi:hypothetical protein